jgi:hypothetical protein
MPGNMFTQAALLLATKSPAIFSAVSLSGQVQKII